MSYISTLHKKDDVIIWERTDNGREMRRVSAPLYFYIEDENGEYESIFKKRLSRVQFENINDFYTAKRDYQSRGELLYESDITPDLKVLSTEYYEKPAPNLHITFHDIEVDYNKKIGFSSVANPYAPISAVTLYHQWLDEFVVYIVPPDKEWLDKGTDSLSPDILKMANVTFCKNEKELLLYYLAEIEDSDVLSGWNSDFFDMPYIGKRIEEALGKSYFRKLSFPGGDEPKYRLVDKFGVSTTTIDLSGRISADYLALFQKYEQEGRRSYKLEAIADEILPELPKLSFKGSLHSLYREDFEFFIRYNIRDVEILKGLEQKLGYVALANEMYHLSGGLFKHVTGTLKLADLAIINYCHHALNVIVPDGPDRGEDESAQIEGALVLDPKIGLHDFVGSIDIKSLYPSTIRAINISPETLRGQFLDNGKAVDAIQKNELTYLKMMHENGPIEELSACDWADVLKKRKWAISGYGTVFSQEVEGVIPAILRVWYSTRESYQKLKKEAEQNNNKDKAAYYDRLQYVYKIKLNSLYGALTNLFFRFFDLRMGESTTGTGRMVLRHQCSKVNEILTGKYDFNGEAVVYGDTDSTYFETWTDNAAEAILVANKIADEVNKSYPAFMQSAFFCTPGFDNSISTSREIVSDRGIFVDKKRYILHIIDKDGKPTDKMKVMGLDTKKTTLPKTVGDKINKFVERFLKGESWDTIAQDIVDYKEYLMNAANVLLIGLPRGIKGVEDYTRQYLKYGAGVKLPGHVAAAIHYNQCLETYNDKENVQITTGMKIKVFYLTQQYGRFKSIALPTDLEDAPEWFTNNFVVDRDAHIERLVDNPLQNILKAINKEVPSKQSLVVDTILDF